MKIPVRAGADFRAGDTHPGVAIVNDAFAKQFLNRENPVGRSFERTGPGGQRIPFKIVGLVGDVRDRDLRNPVPPTVYVPLNSLDGEGALPPRRRATFVVRTSGDDPLTLAPVLRQAVSQARAQFRVSNIRTQEEIIDLHTLRERLLAMLALFFAAVALLLAAVGLYGVLHYSVVQRRREIGIRMALGARAFDVARQVTSGVLAMVLTGALAGLALGMGAVRYIEALFYEVKATDLPMLALPSLAILAATVLAALPAVIRAVRTDPAATLRAE
jgi:predicted lysophospholipase L1 biosynthesis ABC-type transport system permease subunit